MLNAEKYKKEIESFNYMFAVVENKVVSCANLDTCENCEFKARCGGGKIKWLLEECEESILTDEEKAYLKNVIEPLGVEVRHIKKWKSIYIEENKCCYNIAIAVKHPIMETWERDLMNFAVTKEMPFNRLELDKRYSLKDLGL